MATPLLSCHLSSFFKDSHFRSQLQSASDKTTINPVQKLLAYDPPDDVREKIRSIVSKIIGEDVINIEEYTFKNAEEKYKVLISCMKEFSHQITNSVLHELNGASPLIDYFKKPVALTDALHRLTEKKTLLPPNLSIMNEPIRFDPQGSHFGLSAYPGSSTIVNNLDSLQKYKSFKADKTRKVRISRR
ncbi:unnamed protein product [Protopolystoma xenopodis]|uniref:Large ribosomal subunit protein mL50 n=1 Tax=Protopolystoma xenopodis TaxID=117903 RepID=A0A448XQQ4_9PLAT|nr:unnamed protein product [Protopolystoma xenopodis]